MGNIESISIELDKVHVAQTAGQVMKGKVVVYTRRAIEEGELTLQVDGKEKVHTKPLSTDSSSRSERQFFSYILVLHNFRDQPVEGPATYMYPFVIELPSSLPSTTSNLKWTRASGFRIQYKLRVQLRSHKRERYVIVQSAPLPYTETPSQIESIVLPVKGLFMKRGFITLGAKIEDCQVGRGDALDLHLACHNDSTASIKRVHVRVYECMNFSAGLLEKHQLRTLVSTLNVKVPGLNKSSTQRRKIKTNNQQAVAREIQEHLASGQNKVTLMIPKTTHDSYQGQLIHVWHLIEIQFKMAHLATTESKTLNIRIGSARSSKSSAPPMHVQEVASSTPPLPPPTVDHPAPTAPPVQTESAVHAPQIPFSSPVAVPFASATIVPKESGPLIVEEDDIIVLGGDSIIFEGTEVQTPLESLTPVPPTPPSAVPQSGAMFLRNRDSLLNLLIRDMSSSARGGFDVVQARLQDPEWRRFFETLSPVDYGRLVAHVPVDLDQTRLAEELAQCIIQPAFTCAHAAAAVQNASSDWNRSNLAQRLVPLCSYDIVENHMLIRQQLNEWDQTVTGRDFEDAIEAARQQRRLKQPSRGP